jgi:hypothetical protein
MSAIEPRFAGRVVPEPDEETATARELAVYHLARAEGFWLALINGPHWPDASLHLVTEYALGLTYLHLSDDDARAIYRKVCNGEEIGEHLFRLLPSLGIDPNHIKAFQPREVES